MLMPDMSIVSRKVITFTWFHYYAPDAGSAYHAFAGHETLGKLSATYFPALTMVPVMMLEGTAYQADNGHHLSAIMTAVNSMYGLQPMVPGRGLSILQQIRRSWKPFAPPHFHDGSLLFDDIDGCISFSQYRTAYELKPI